MARKLLAKIRSGSFLAALGAALAAGQVWAQGGAQQSAPPTVIENPYAAVTAKSNSAPDMGQPPGRGAITYQNPFAALSSAPPIEPPVLPGPTSRWRRSVRPVDELSTVKTAILSTNPIYPGPLSLDESAPADVPSDRGTGPVANSEPPQAARGSSRRLEEIGAALQPLVQPTWFAADEVAAEPSVQTRRAAFDGSEVGVALDVSVGGGLNVMAAEPDLWPLVISNYSNSPDGWLQRAQQAARVAESLDDVTAVANICQRGLAGAPPVEIAASLRRLAAWAHNRRGELLVEAGRAQEAIDDFQMAIALDPNCSLAIHNRAVTLAQQGRLDDALSDFNRVIEINPGLAVAYRNRGELLVALGRINGAVADYSRAAEALPDDADLYAARGYAWHRLGDFDRALADFQQSLAIDPNCAEAYRSLAWLHATCSNERYRDAEQALAAANQAAKLAPPGDYLALDTLAAAHASAGQFGRAERIQQQAIAAAPSESIGPLRRRLALYQQGRPFRAETHSERQ